MTALIPLNGTRPAAFSTRVGILQSKWSLGPAAPPNGHSLGTEKRRKLRAVLHRSNPGATFIATALNEK